MVHDPLSTLLVGRLTRLLDLNCLEELKALEECGYVKENIELQETDELDRTVVYEKHQVPVPKGTNQLKTVFRGLSRKEEHHTAYGLVIPREKLEAMVQLIDFLKTDVGAEGIFRISGNKKRQLDLKNVIQKGKNINLGVDELPYNMHDIAGILKEFFGDLEEPLLTKQLYDCYQQLAGKFKDMDSEIAFERKLETLRTLFLLLPPLNRFLLKKLIELLAVVADNLNNKMDAYNLGVVFAPNIICTRQVTGSTEFTENMEPLTDLMKFIIENSSEVFQIPEDFLEEAKEYKKKIKEESDDVPMTRTYCQRIDSKEYKKEAQNNTNEAIALLYTQILEMPDGTKKSDFLTKFYASYPGTPPYISKTMRKTSRASCDNVSTQGTPSKPRGDSSENCCIGSRRIEEHLLSPAGKYGCQSTRTSNPTNIPISPGAKFKHCLKRVRRTSQEILNPKLCKIPPPDHPPIKSVESSDSRCTKVKNILQSYKKSALKTLRRSLSSPTLLVVKPKGSTSSDDSYDDVYSGELSPDDCGVHKSMELISCDDGRAKKSSSNFHHKSMDELSSDNVRDKKYFEKLNRCNAGLLTDEESDGGDKSEEDGDKSDDDGDNHKSITGHGKVQIEIVFPSEEKGINNSAFTEEQGGCCNDNVTPAIRKSLYPCVRTVVVKNLAHSPETTNVRTPVICKKDVISKGTPLVNRTLTLENMRRVHERKLLAGKLAEEKHSLSNYALGCEKENMGDVFLGGGESSLNVGELVKASTKCIIEPMSDITNVSLHKFRHISLHDSPRSDAKESIKKKVGLLAHISVGSSRSSSSSIGGNDNDEIRETCKDTSEALNSLYNKQIITSI